ncbi:hypothetical protein D6C86_02267 [Aureobasidium pullulans]|uniref:Nuclear pore complex protein n=1 Tax=Aureobasidium pullulans TaxID=5580 RepID=A0A4S9WHB8_AURPU|nr:hypothetical protein D6C94_02664 [Aureobasidium pullulans]THZ47605.1 hypothetical protein D6C87_01222 [Aureobasidium pullulans]THZ64725.1 hypothetical protein D6C86_02267 [Aureobasidium pullulans]THZ90013.1 hypothetical protein D6C88_04364 [Aureobasidium pullulans]
MAPVTRKTASSGAFKPVHRKSSQTNTNSFADIVRTNGYSISQNGDTNRSVLVPTNQLADQINPLRDMADRVGREVDHFAETLDKFNDRLHGQDAYDAAIDLTQGYRDFASGMVKKLKKRHDAQRVNEMKNDFGKRVTQSPIRSSSVTAIVGPVTHNDGDDDMPAQTSLDTLRQWQAELDTWDLFRIMLDLRYSPKKQLRQQDKEARLAELGTQNTYTSDAELWERFTLDNDSARERHLVVKWLQAAANHGESDIEAIADELEKKSGRGTGIWFNGWMETRERIKGTKRMRVYSTASPESLDVKRTHSNEPLVSSLDPDAPTRQYRVLEKADEYSERALWMTCWEMLRRGHSWFDICQWCSERNQSWRAVSMAASSDSDANIALPGVSAGSLWRRMCYSLVQGGSTDEYEAAVYGVLSGDLDSVKRVCQSWDDCIFAHYNSLLIGQLEEYLQKSFPERFSSGITNRFALFDSLRHHGDQKDVAQNLIRRLMEQSSTSQEAQQPLKLLQGSLIADTFSDLCKNLATAISDAAWYQTTSTTIAPLRTAVSPDTQRESVIFNDYDSLRIVTHMVLMLREFHEPLSDTKTDPQALDNIIAAYIQLLRAAGKWDLTPVYAARMSPVRGTKSLAQTMTDVQTPQEKMHFTKLMAMYGIDPVAVLIEQTKYLMEEVLPIKSNGQRNLKIIENSKEDIYPGQRVKLDFVEDGRGGEGIADHLGVFHLIEGQWDITFQTLAYACRKLLLSGCFLEASHLVDQLSFDMLCGAKSRSILGTSVNVMDREETSLLLQDVEHVAKLRVLQKQCRGYYELSLLVKAVDALNVWRRVEHDYATKVPRPSSLPAKVKAAFENTCAAIEPVLSGILLHAKDVDDEAADLIKIRNWYLPEIVLAYNAVLCAAAHMISRDHLLRSMELANDVANDKTGLAECFMESGRMRELVIAFAQSSETMLKLSELNQSKREKKNKAGKNLAIWEISA